MNRFIPFLILLWGLSVGNCLSQTVEASFYEEKSDTFTILFDFGLYDIQASYDSTIISLAREAVKLPKYRIEITAHTDAIGSLEANQILSRNRANAVAEALIQAGVDTNNLTYTFKGELEPIASNDEDAGRQQNRRASVILYKKKPATCLQGTVRDDKTKVGLPAQIVLRTKSWRDTFMTDSSGQYKRLVPANQVMGIDVYAPCYFYASEMIKTKPIPVNNKDFALSVLEVGKTIALNNLYYVGGRPILLEKSKPELPKILRFMESNPWISIAIQGHVNVPFRAPIPEDDPSFLLSINRAKVVYDFLLANGIEESRISYEGFGNSQMKFPKARSEREQALNRRVEIKVVKSECE